MIESKSFNKVSIFIVLYSLIFEFILNKALVAFADKSSEACFRLPVYTQKMTDMEMMPRFFF